MMTSDFGQAVEAAARSMFISMSWKRAIVEPEGQAKSQAHYESIMARHWDAGTAGESNYTGFRLLAMKAFRAANGVPVEEPSFPDSASMTRNSVVIDRSNLDPRFGTFMAPSAPNKFQDRDAKNYYRMGWLKRPDARVVEYV